MVNPDGLVWLPLRAHIALSGVTLGHYRNDSRGVNLNRMYNTPTEDAHPTSAHLASASPF